MSLHERFSLVARAHAKKVAIVHEADEVRYEAILERSLAVAAWFARSLDERSVVGLSMHAPPAFVVAYFGAAFAGAKIVLLDPRMVSELPQSIRHFEITHLLCTENERPEVEPYVREQETRDIDETIFVLGRVKTEHASADFHYHQSDFVVHCTSGSTGSPKGIVLSNENISNRVVDWARTLSLTEQDTILCSLTLSHCHGIDILMLPGILTGCRVVAPSLDRISVRRIARFFKQEGITFFSSLPYVYELMLQTLAPENVDLSRLRHMLSGSAPLSDATALAFRERFRRGIQQVYGLSEIGAICMSPDPDNAGSVGELVLGVEGWVSEDGEPAGRGELVVRGAGLARGYLHSPAAERTYFRDGWLWTQDVVEHGPGGYRIVGRRSRFINTGGNKVDPVEVEQALRENPKVLEAVVTSRRDSLRGEQIVAFVRVGSALAADELRAFLRQRLALFKVPDEIRFVDHIPKSGIGKVQVSAFDAHLAGEQEGAA